MIIVKEGEHGVASCKCAKGFCPIVERSGDLSR